MAGHASGSQWNPVGVGYTGAVARAAEKIPTGDLPPLLSAVGATGQPGAHPHVLAEEMPRVLFNVGFQAPADPLANTGWILLLQRIYADATDSGDKQ